MAKNNNKNNNNNTGLKKFISIVIAILTVYCIAFIGFIGYAYFIYQDKDVDKNSFIDKFVQNMEPELPERTTILVTVTDQNGERTDSIILVSYNTISKKISLVSIPRDTQVTITGSMLDTMISNYSDVRSTGGVMKINAISLYGGSSGMDFLEEYIEDLLDIQIDYHAKLDFNAFRYIIDSLGGIEFDVPVDMYYSDPTQDLLINLKKGLQVLDGDKSEQLLRYRSYAMGDLERIQVQQDFLKVFFKKVVSTQSIMSNPTTYFTTMFNYLETDFGISDAIKYFKELQNIDVNNIESYTIPCTLDPVYVFVNKQEAQEFAYAIFNQNTVPPENIVYESSLFKSIQVLNGSGVAGIARQTQEYLEENGYTVISIGDSQDPREEHTNIYVKEEGIGYDIKALFDNAEVVVNPYKLKDTNYEIIVVVGTNDSYVYDAE
ncbi:MAG: LCP family protein [bacterium]